MKDKPVGTYIGRTSLAAIGSKPSTWAQSLPLEFTAKAHPWHHRMINADFQKTHEEMLAEMAGDFVLIDLIDERGGLIEYEPGHYVTYSEIMKMSNYARVTDRATIVGFTEAWAPHWYGALPRFASILRKHIPEDKIIIHHAYYADHSKIGTNANRHLERMYAEIQRLFPAAASIRASERNLQGDPDHRWGAAPYHYVPGYYEEMGEMLFSIAEGRSTGSGAIIAEPTVKKGRFAALRRLVALRG
ncbi:hypothetical protein D3Y55_26580 [Mesorhizobium sp. DCY119]|nr:hypothetical protein D3Y55_26580 [Mesorhizobium sp. DCY119]